MGNRWAFGARRAGRGQRSQSFRLIVALALAAAPFDSSDHGFGLAVAQLVDARDQDFYANTRSIVEQPLADLLRDFPELRALEPAENQPFLSDILDKAGRRLEAMYANLQNTAADEEIVQERVQPGTRAATTRRQNFSYLILAPANIANPVFEEYRTDSLGRRIEPQSPDDRFAVTANFASLWIHFHPANRSASNFRYLGRQATDGRACDVVAFAQRPGWATVTGKVVSKLGTVVILHQGLAWIDRENDQIIRMRLDLLAPRTDIKLEKQTTEIRFEEVRLPRRSSPVRLPGEVVVTTVYDGWTLRNTHRYSNYKLFGSDVTIKPVESNP